MAWLVTGLSLLTNISSVTQNLRWPGVAEVVHYGTELLAKAEDFIGGTDQVKNEMAEISAMINNLEYDLKQSQAKILQEIDKQLTYHQTMHDLSEHGVYIDSMFDRFQLYSNDSSYEKVTLIDFAKSCTSHDGDQLPSHINSLHRLVKPTGPNTHGLFDVVTQGRNTPEQQARSCSETRSIQQDIYLLYMIISVYMVKGFTMRQYAYQILKSFEQGEFTTEKAQSIKDYDAIMGDIIKAALTSMSSASRIIRRCDPKNHKEGETFAQLKWLFGTMVTNEIFLNPEKSCEWKCPRFNDVELYANDHPAPVGRCNGRVYNCSKAEFDSVCATTDPNRRYNGFVGKTRFGIDGFSSQGIVDECNIQPIAPESAHIPETQWSFSGETIVKRHRCRNCVCTCDDYEYSETARTFSLRPVESDFANNKVITGARLVESKNVFYIQIQQGKLGANGAVDLATLEWLEPEEIDHKNHATPANYYYTVSLDKNGVNLDTVAIKAGQALTGIRFNSDGSNLKLEVRGASVNYADGTVEKPDDWISKEVSNRVEVTMVEPDIPTKAADENIVDTQENGFIKFRQTDLKKDAAQTAIPFLDTQLVITNPPVLLSGAGIHYKGLRGYGGFLGLHLVTYDYSQHVEVKPAPAG